MIFLSGSKSEWRRGEVEVMETRLADGIHREDPEV
jgi:hypothetical protein